MIIFDFMLSLQIFFFGFDKYLTTDTRDLLKRKQIFIQKCPILTKTGMILQSLWKFPQILSRWMEKLLCEFPLKHIFVKAKFWARQK